MRLLLVATTTALIAAVAAFGDVTAVAAGPTATAGLDEVGHRGLRSDTQGRLLRLERRDRHGPHRRDRSPGGLLLADVSRPSARRPHGRSRLAEIRARGRAALLLKNDSPSFTQKTISGSCSGPESGVASLVCHAGDSR